MTPFHIPLAPVLVMVLLAAGYAGQPSNSAVTG